MKGTRKNEIVEREESQNCRAEIFPVPLRPENQVDSRVHYRVQPEPKLILSLDGEILPKKRSSSRRGDRRKTGDEAFDGMRWRSVMTDAGYVSAILGIEPQQDAVILTIW
ncbi:Hypothetical protein NTJ_05834 [Nesidiocoris tenuis]|nr:Hypothetical protein NTJ_05834 [Nesidiocoris tenuis]